MNFGSVWYIVWAWMNRHSVSHSNSQISSNNLVHEELTVLCFRILSCQSNANSLFALFTYEEDMIRYVLCAYLLKLLHLL